MKSRKIYLTTLSIGIVLIICLLNMINVKAIEKNITNVILSENGKISLPVFDVSDDYIYPGAEISKDFVLKNITQKDYKIQNIGLDNFKIIDNNGKKLDVYNDRDLKLIEEFYESVQCSVSYEGNNNDKTLYSDDIRELTKGKTLEKEISIPSGNGKNINVEIVMKKAAGNNMQGLQANFDMVFNAVSYNGNSQNTDSELVQTGSPIDTVTLLIIGFIFIGTGFVIYLRRRASSIEK